MHLQYSLNYYYTMRKVRILFLLFFLPVFTLSALEELRFENITNKEGLSHNTVRHIMQDSCGFMWFSTVNGLNRYDGHKFVSIHPGFEENSLIENNIRRTIEDKNGRIWVQTTTRFMHCYDTNVESFTNYSGGNEVEKFRRIEVLPDGEVWLWGMENGACRVRYENNVLVPTLFDVKTIGTNDISFVLRDATGQVWIGTNKGLIQLINDIPKFCNTHNKTYDYHSVIETQNNLFFFTKNKNIIVYDKKHKVFKPTLDFGKWNNGEIRSVLALNERSVLVTGKQQILLFDTENFEITDARRLFGGEVLENANSMRDNRKGLWIFNRSGFLWGYNEESRQFEKYSFIPENILSLIDSERFNICRDSRGIVWVTTYGNGLFCIEKSGKINHFTTENSGLKTDYLLTVAEDRLGNIWIGTENTGLVKIHLSQYNYQQFFPEPDKPDAAKRTIRCIYEETSSGNLWLGTKQGDVYVFDENLKQQNKFSLKQGVPYCIMPDSQNNMWIGTKGNGLVIIPSGKASSADLKFYSLSEDRNAGASNIYALLRDNKNRIWAGTLGGGLYLCQFTSGVLQATPFRALSEVQEQVRCLFQDSSGLIWVGGSNGVVTFNPDEIMADNTAFQWFHFDQNNKQSLNNNIVKVIFEDSNRQIWLGTSGGGLNRVEKNTEGELKFKHYTMKEGLVDDMVQGILEDDEGNLWISTENGISKFNPEEVSFENYSSYDSWESNMFCESSAYKRKNGELLFGSYNGMYIFNSSLFENHSFSPPVTLTGLAINGIPVTPNTPDSPLKESITKVKQIRLKDGQNSFSIEFSSLSFQWANSNRYTYILENYDEEWNPVTQYNVAIYKNIPAGKYLFKVKNVNNPHGLDINETQLQIIVVPPFWKSTNAIILYIILLIIAVWFAIRLAIKMNKLHNDVIIEKQLTDFRLRFFTNISHEFRTPLTIIQGSIENMNSMKLTGALKKNISILDKSASKLLRLIDQLLEFRKLQNDKMDLRLERTEVVGFLRSIFELFQESAERKRIQLTFSSNKESHEMLMDKGKFDKILFNLLSNAFKHTPENGKIAVELFFNDLEELFTLKVSDSGIGIPPEKRDQLFVRFKQINYSSSGIGIGLNLSSELALEHKGKIEYEQSEWGGACFIVSIPMAESVYDPGDILLHETSRPDDIYKERFIDNEITVSEEEPIDNSLSKKYKILLIEDDEEIRSFLKEQLGKMFIISTASDGMKGWKMAVEGEFDLIVCDVMMPEMDGFEVTRKLKSDIETSHIPIILLTAHSSIEHQLEGINAGADSYIKKPFSTRYLISRITKLIEQREKLQYKFAHEPGEIQTTICTSDRDSAFIDKVQKVIEKHLDNSEFSIDDFAHEVNMGRTLFYKKIKGITNLSPNEYLRVVRLKKATELLRTTDLNVSEIAYQVGFSNPDYFYKCFKDQFKITPSQFRSGKLQKEND